MIQIPSWFSFFKKNDAAGVEAKPKTSFTGQPQWSGQSGNFHTPGFHMYTSRAEGCSASKMFKRIKIHGFLKSLLTLANLQASLEPNGTDMIH